MLLRPLIALALLAPAAALAQPAEPSGRYRKSPAVLARYPDVPVTLRTPALARGGVSSEAEMTAHLQALARRSPRVQLGSLGRSGHGRDIPVLVFAAEGRSTPAEIHALGRPVVWLIGCQHGNEPAGGEAMLALAWALADGELAPLLDRITVVIVPRANPDGAADGRRRTSADLDLNRDHLLATLPEARAMQAFMAELPPDLVIDAHEYAAAGPWLAAFGALAPWDAMFLEATHPAVPRAVTGLAERVFRPAMEAKLARYGLSSHTYLASPGGEAEEGVVPTGGTAPGISRNYFGLTGAVSLLVETRGGDAGREGLQRRVATHYLAAAAALETAAGQAPLLRRTVDEARRGLAADQAELAVAYEVPTTPAVLGFIDAETAAPRPVQVELRDSRQVRVTARRSRPAGYLVTAKAADAIAALHNKGVKSCAAAPRPLKVEAYRLPTDRIAGPAAREGIHGDHALTAAVQPATITPAPGAVYIPMDQPQAAVVAAVLEPDSPGSYAAVGLAWLSAEGEPPIYRVPAGSRAECA